MAGKNPQLRIGVVGLGRRWRRHYRPALLGLLHRFDLRAVCDPVPARAEREARLLGCSAAVGPLELLSSSDIKAVLVIDPGWWRLWPLQLACRHGKPVFCAASLARDGRHADLLREQVRASGLPVQMALLPRLAPAAARLDDLLARDLGPPRLVVCDVATSRPRTQPLAGISLGLLDWCARLIGKAPEQVTARELPAAGLSSVLYEFAGGTAVQVLSRRVAAGNSSVRLQVVAERGGAEVLFPRRLRWTTPSGRHAHVLPPSRPVGRLLLEQFHQALLTGHPPQPDLEPAYRAWEWLRAARYSGETGRSWPGPNDDPAR